MRTSHGKVTAADSGHEQTHAVQRAPERREPQFPYNPRRDKLPGYWDEDFRMRRRQFIAGLGGAAAWPLAAGAQQPAMPVIGYLRSGSRAFFAINEAAFRQGLTGMGFVEGRNVAIDYQYVDGQYDRLSASAADLLRRQVSVIYAADNAAATTIKAVSTTTPIVFRIGGDPIELGLVTSLNRPEGNLTGVSFVQTTTAGIRVQMLHEAVPNAAVVGQLANSANPNAEIETREAQEAAHKLGLDFHVVNASNAEEIDAAFATLLQKRIQALVVIGDPFLSNRRQQVVALTVRHAIPAIFSSREFPDAGGLMSYGASNVDADRLGGTYVGRILKGEKPADLPVQQAVKVELIVNLIIAKALGLTIPETLLATADEVIQ
jgi:putative tryptophan/tyrosine transport system substrate-binding protein